MHMFNASKFSCTKTLQHPVAMVNDLIHRVWFARAISCRFRSLVVCCMLLLYKYYFCEVFRPHKVIIT
jgi:hypothetical protein